MHRLNLKAGLVLVALLLLVALFSRAQTQRGTVPQSEMRAGRYQLLATKLLAPNVTGGKTPFDTVLMIDTQTGNVWEYDPRDDTSDPGGGLTSFPSRMRHVFTDDINGTKSEYFKTVQVLPGTQEKK